MKPSKNNGERSVFDVKASGAHHHPQRKFIKRFFYDRNVLNLRPHLIFRRPVAWALGVLVLLLGIFFIVHNRPSKADVKDFYPSTCLGDWQWATNAQNKPDTLITPSSSFSPANSAMYDATGTEIYCGGFLPSDYDGTGTITSVGVTLVWQVGDGTVALPSSSAPVSGDGGGGGSVSDASSTFTSSTTPNTTSTTTDGATSTTTSSASSTDTLASSTPDENTSSTAPLVTTTVTTTTSNTTASTTITDTGTNADTNTNASTTDVAPPPASAPASTPAPADTSTDTTAPADASPAPDTSGDASASSSAVLFVRSLLASLVHPAFADDTSTVATDTSTIATDVASSTSDTASTTPSNASSTTNIASDTASSTDDIASDTLPIAPPVPDDNFLEVSYSTDGQTWIPLRGVNMSNWPNLTLAIPVSQWSDLQNLQVRIDDMPSTQSPIPTVFLDGMFVEVQYDVAATANGGPAPIYTDFTTDKTIYTQGDLAEVTGAPAESAIEIYSLDVLDSPGQPSHVYGTRLDNTGGTEIDTNTLPPGHYALVNTFESGTCNQYSLADCEARTDFISEEDIMVLPPPATQ